ncbi:unnamed protein product [Scytosiphon promiscuus]
MIPGLLPRKKLPRAYGVSWKPRCRVVPPHSRQGYLFSWRRRPDGPWMRAFSDRSILFGNGITGENATTDRRCCVASLDYSGTIASATHRGG